MLFYIAYLIALDFMFWPASVCRLWTLFPFSLSTVSSFSLEHSHREFLRLNWICMSLAKSPTCFSQLPATQATLRGLGLTALDTGNSGCRASMRVADPQGKCFPFHLEAGAHTFSCSLFSFQVFHINPPNKGQTLPLSRLFVLPNFCKLGIS